jgi:hypothetical protein
MNTVFQTIEKNPTFSIVGNGQFGNLTRTGWVRSRLGESKKLIIIEAITDSNVDKVYKRGNKIYAMLLNGTEKVIG